MQKQEIRIISAHIQQHVSYARSQALVRHTTVVICSSEDLIRCEKDKWNKGLLIFTDKNKNKQVDSEDHILLKTENKIKYGKLTWVGSASSRDVLTLQGDTGLPRGSPGSFYYLL
ncbi:MAG: GspH/FimT family protein [Pseudomonadota bacterium]